jgi:nitrate reductase gamma subunit
MSLLDFARGPALEWSLIIMVFGILWRLVGAFLFRSQVYLSRPKGSSFVAAGLRTIVTRSWPDERLEKAIRFQHYSGYLFHITLFIVIFLFEPHIAFFQWVLGFSWPGLPTNVVTFAAAVTVATLVALAIRRATNPILKGLTNADDWFSWFVTIAPVVTGMMAFAHQNIGIRYEDLLGIHILSVCLLFIWIPFGKLMHMFLIFPGRYQIGAKFEFRGVRA